MVQGFWLRLVRLVCLLSLILATSCNFPAANSLSTTPTIVPQTEADTDLPPVALVTIQVQVPPDTPVQDKIVIRLLDEVTGLALNARQNELRLVSDRLYEISLPFQVGAEIKYRFARQSAGLMEEFTTANRPVRYRLYHVDGPATVQDVVSAWSDSNPNLPTGSISGFSRDVSTGLPIPELLVFAGGVQTQTDSDGSFLLEDIPEGVHNLVVYAMDGSYRTFQQGAKVAAGSTTPAQIVMQPAHLTNITFRLSVPKETLPGVPIRLAGNLLQLGNTFADLNGGISTLAVRMPVLTLQPDGSYQLDIQLPAGTFLEYKYTLGDGLWNAEHTLDGAFRLRSLVVPDQASVIEDNVLSWSSGSTAGPILFDLMVPEATPQYDYVSIQFNPGTWTESIPMWGLGKNHWAYLLNSPLNMQSNISYRYCRNDQCGVADDQATAGANAQGRTLTLSGEYQKVNDQILSWAWFNTQEGSGISKLPTISPRDAEFMAGVAAQPSYHPSWTPRWPVALKEVQSLGASWIFFSPTWSITRQNPPLIAPVIGKDPLWSDTASAVDRAHNLALKVALQPEISLEDNIQNWWIAAPRDSTWWASWFEQYQDFLLHHADLAEKVGSESLILGGEWVTPALPDGKLADGSPSGVSPDAETRWNELIKEVRNHYHGKLIWATPATTAGIILPPFIGLFDQVEVVWSLPLSTDPQATSDQLSEAAFKYMKEYILPMKNKTGKPVFIMIKYPSAQGALSGCIPLPENSPVKCFDPDQLSQPNPDIATVTLSLSEQERAYDAVLRALNEADWISGFVSQGYYPPAELQDKSSSIHGKPAADLLAKWFPQLIGSNSQ